MVQLSLAPARNEKLFSRNYLEDRLPNSKEWADSQEEARQAWTELKDIYSEEKNDLSERRNDEEGLRHKFISPILERVLDYSIEKEKTAFGQSSPDYALYQDDEKRSDALGSEDEYSNAIGLLEAKAWEKKLEMKKKGGGQLYDRLNPTVQVMEYLYNSEPRWAILTNGKRWRLYNQEASSKMDTYYEVNLITILENDNFKQFKYFYLLFRKEAIEGREGDAFVDKVKEESNRYARDVGEDLEDNLYKALLWLTKGITDVNTNDVDPEEELDELQNESLIFLYRLVFLFYVDSREIMPDPAEKGETLYSFPSMVDDVMDDIESGEVEEYSVSYYNQLKEIFEMVNKGSEAQGIDRDKLFVPPYNGKLFSSEEHPFLEENKIRDQYMAKVIELLARDDEDRRIDYSDLSVRHLGGIYEGLLEYELNYATKPKVLEDGKYKNLSELDKDREDFEEDDVVEEELYLATDEEERKATGSYYTPDYIVEYIVENTVGPKVEEKIEKAKKEAEKEELDQKVQEKVLDLDVLDPAMGSGHFLVEVIDYIASEILEYTEKDIQEVKRDVARRCIYGVDVNNMATELAKVSIWLNTISSEKPLSFLDHHLKTGNSLIGADIFELDRHPEEEKEEQEVQTDDQGNMPITQFDSDPEDNSHSIEDNIQQLLEMYQRIMEMPENQPDDIHEQADIYHEFRNHKFRQRFDVLADVHTSYYFGNDYTEDQYHELLGAMQRGSNNWQNMKQQDWVKNATNAFNHHNNIANQKQFFHWKLEFPEVFFDIDTGKQKQNPGFDAVVGNPPYGYRGIPTDHEKNYLEKNFETHEYNYENYLYFTELSTDLLNSRGLQGYIIPNTFLSADKMQIFREFLLKDNALSELFYLGQDVFEGVTLESVIEIIDQRKQSSDIEVKLSKDSTINPEKSYGASLDRFRGNEGKVLDIDLTPKRRKIVSKMKENSTKLENISYVTVGINTGYIRDEMTSDQKEDERYHKMLNGKNIGRYELEWDGRWIIYDKEFVDSFGDKGRTLPPERIFTEPKILLQRTRRGLKRKLIAVLDEDQFYNLNRVSNVVLENNDYSLYAILGLLNSKLLDRYFDWVFNEYEVKPSHLKKLSIIDRKPENYTPDLENAYQENSLTETATGINDREKISLLSDLSEAIQKRVEEKGQINLKIRDYLGNYSDGEPLGDICMPAEGRADTILAETEDDREGLKVEHVRIEEDRGGLVLSASAKYKPENEDEFDDEEFDRWGYVETDFFPAMRFDVGEKMEALIQEFVPVAVDNGDAGFKKKATSNISLISRLEDIQLPKLSDVEDGLEKFIENKEKAEGLEQEIQETDELIDAIVFDLYDLNEEEVETVLDSLDTEEDEKRPILEKFGEQRD
jgi:hypothetical protein